MLSTTILVASLLAVSTAQNVDGTTIAPATRQEGTTTPNRQPESTTLKPSTRQEGTTTPTRQPEGTTTPTRQPESTTTPTRQPEGTTTPTRQPEGTPKPSTRQEGTTTPTRQPEGTTRGGDGTTRQPEGTTRGGDNTITRKEETRATTRGGEPERTIGRTEATKPPTRPVADFREAAEEAAKCRIVGLTNCDTDLNKDRQELIDATKQANGERAATRTADRTRVEDLARDIATKEPAVVCKSLTDVAAACSKECDFSGGDGTKEARFGAALQCVSDEKAKVLGAEATKEEKEQARTDLKSALQSGLALLPEKQRQEAQKVIDQSSEAEEKRNERAVTLIEINAKVYRAKGVVDDKNSTPTSRAEARKALQEANGDAAKKAAVDRLPGNRPNVCSKLIDGVAQVKADKAGERDKSKFVDSVTVLHVKIDVPEDKLDWVRNEARKINADAEVEKSDSDRLTKITTAGDTKATKKRGTASCEVFVPADVADYDITSTKVSTIVAEAGGSVTGVSSIGQADVEAAKTVSAGVDEDVIDGAPTLFLSAVLATVSIVVAFV